MPTIDLTPDQVTQVIAQLSAEQKKNVLLSLAAGATEGRAERMTFAEDQLRELCRQGGLEWDSMSDDERQEFIDDVVHEART